MPANIAGASRAEDRVGHSVTDDVAVRMRLESLLEWDPHAAENQRPSGNEPMQIVSVANAQRRHLTGTRREILSHRQIVWCRDLEVSRIAFYDADRVPGPFREHGFIRRLTTEAQRVAEYRDAKRLWRLREIDALARQRRGNRAIAVGLLDRVVRAQGRNRSAGVGGRS